MNDTVPIQYQYSISTVSIQYEYSTVTVTPPPVFSRGNAVFHPPGAIPPAFFTLKNKKMQKKFDFLQKNACIFVLRGYSMGVDRKNRRKAKQQNKEKEKMEKRNYYVANDNGDVAGHDLDYATAQTVLEEAERENPGEGWEILEDER